MNFFRISVVGCLAGFSTPADILGCDGCGGLGGPDYDVIKTHHDTFPNFGKNYTAINTQSGDWSDPDIWSTGLVPNSQAIVRIKKDTIVTYNLDSTVRIDAIGIEGTLRFHTEVVTRLFCKHLLVYRSGAIEVGSTAEPVQHPAIAEIVFIDEPIDFDKDPSQYGNGLLVFGRLDFHGSPQPSTFIRTLSEPVTGDTTLQLTSPAWGWRAGDRLYIPDTRQVDPNESEYVPQWEEPVIQEVSQDGLTVLLTAALQYDHLGATDGAGQLELLPHVANQSRNVVLRSENPGGTRGHTLFAERAEIDCRYAEFRGLGRTTVDPIDNTTYDEDGNVTHVGSNQIARYPIHPHHLIGPLNSANLGFQYKLIGNAVTQDSLKWGIAIHGSHFGLIQDNVVCHVDGSGIVTEDGSETGNRIDHNFVGRVLGGGVSHPTADIGDLGDAYWFRGPMNTVVSNVAVNALVTGFDAFSQNLSTVKRPNFRGADMNDELQTTTTTIRHQSFDAFKGNECYGATPTALMFWAIGDRLTPNYGSDAAETNRVEDFTSWHVSDQGTVLYYISHIVIDGWVQRGELSQIRASSYNSDASGIRFSGSRCVRAYIRNADIQGMQYGIVNRGRGRAELLVVEDSYLRNFINVVVRPWIQDPPSGYRETQLKNNVYEFLPNPPSNPDFLPYHISMEWRPPTDGNINKLETVRVFNLQSRPGSHPRSCPPNP